jgi:bacteriorhodopsin
MTMYAMSNVQYQSVYNVLSFALASMMATTMYLWFRASAVHQKYTSAVIISGLVTFIAAYHYIRIFNSWVDAYSYSAGKVADGAMADTDPALTGVPFNDAYRYMDWLLTVPLLLIEILLVMELDEKTFSCKAWALGLGSALMIVSGYYGELIVTGNLTPRWTCWGISMLFFLYIVYELLVGLSEATNKKENECAKDQIKMAQVVTVISWCTYPVVYLFPMLGIKAATAVVGIQIGYCASDIISKCGVGLLIYRISYAKSGEAQKTTGLLA